MDVGCGGGILAESLARLPVTRKVIAVDPTPEVLKVAKAHMRRDPGLRGRLEYRQGTVEGVRFSGEEVGTGGFDVVSSSDPQALEGRGRKQMRRARLMRVG